jgi:hypothetical protein
MLRRALRRSEGQTRARKPAFNRSVSLAPILWKWASMMKALWILQDIGPCMYKHIVDKRFLGTDENLFSGFFVALQTFAKCIGSEEVTRLDLDDLTFSFVKSTNTLFVIAAEKNVDTTQTLLQVRQAFNDVFPSIKTPLYNPLIPTDLKELEERIGSMIKTIIAPTTMTPQMQQSRTEGPVSQPEKRAASKQSIKLTKETVFGPEKPETIKQASRLTGEMVPRLEKPLTSIQRERTRLIKRFGVVAVDVLHLADGKLTISEIASKSRTEEREVEEILAFARVLGVVEFIESKAH